MFRPKVLLFRSLKEFFFFFLLVSAFYLTANQWLFFSKHLLNIYRYNCVAPNFEVKRVFFVQATADFSPSETKDPWEPWRKLDRRSRKLDEEVCSHGNLLQMDPRLPGSVAWLSEADASSPLSAGAIPNRHSGCSTSSDEVLSLSES